MRPCSSWLFAFPILLLCSLPGPVVAQVTGRPASSSAAPIEPEKQLPLDVDRDPVASPDKPEVAVPKEPQNPGAIGRGEGGRYTLQRNVDEVILNVTVLDDKQHLVSTLGKDDFKIFEDGVLQSISSFQHQDIPVSLGILVDNSGSMRAKRNAVNTSALDLVRASNKDDESFVVNFSDEAYIDQDFTSNVVKLRDGLTHIDSKGGTALYDAIMASADYLTKNAKRSKQVLLVITDGEDNASSTTLEETVRRIQDLQGPVIYSIGLLYDDSGGGREARRARRALEMLANETGGVSFFPKNLDQVDTIAGEVARDIREQYTIGYHSTKAANLGGFRRIQAEAKAKGYGKLDVRTRTGYYPNTKAKNGQASAPQSESHAASN
jgi:Ca-activated chloride channel homolog